MPNLTPQQEAYCSRLPESNRAWYRLRASRMTEAQRELERMTWEVMKAVECDSCGEPHKRLTTMVDRTRERYTRMYAEQAAFLPKQPKIIVTQPVDITQIYRDYTDIRFGLGGAVRQE